MDDEWKEGMGEGKLRGMAWEEKVKGKNKKWES